MAMAKVDMVLNIGSYIGLFAGKLSTYRFVNTYEDSGYCILAPRPDVRKVFTAFVKRPFNQTVWQILMLSIFCGGLVVFGFKLVDRNIQVRPVRFMVDVYSIFLQQAVPFRKNRLILRLLLQLFIFMIIVLGNVHQALVISCLTKRDGSMKEQDLDHLIAANDYEILSDPIVLGILEVSNQEVYSKIKNVSQWVQNTEYIKTFQNAMTTSPKKVLIVGCDAVNELLNTELDAFTKAEDIYFQLNKKMMTYSESILLTRRTPFNEKLNEMSLRIHESGIKHYWKVLGGFDGKRSSKDDENVLKMNEMIMIMRIFCRGMFLSGMIFLSELVFGKFLSHYMRLIFRRYIKKWLKAARKFRAVKVRPRMVTKAKECDDLIVEEII